MRKILAAGVCCLASLSAPPRAAEPTWHLTATVAESCSDGRGQQAVVAGGAIPLAVSTVASLLRVGAAERQLPKRVTAA